MLFLIAGVVFTAQTAARAQSPWYVEGSAGGFWRMDTSASTTFFNTLGVTAPGTNTITYQPGYVLNLGLGYKLPLGFRVEVEGSYAHYVFDSVSPLVTNGVFPLLNGTSLPLQSGGGHDQYSAAFNAFYDLPMTGGMIPYIGTGIGVAYSTTEAGHFAGAGGIPQFTQIAGHATNPSVMGEAGVAINLSPQWAIVPSYRFEKLLTNSGGFANQANIIKLGFRYAL